MDLESAGVVAINVKRQKVDISVSARLARLRNHGIHISEADWIAFLDDDNQYESDHLESLLAHALKTKTDAVHSHRLLIELDGAPWKQDRFPWPCPGLDDQAAIQWLRDEGVFVHGSPVMRDRAVLSNGRPGTVDTSEWLIRREVCQQIPWPEGVTRDQELQGIGEDGLWLRLLIAAGILIESSQHPSIVFQRGGRFEFI